MTPKQRQALDYIEGYIDQHGSSPSQEEIAQALGLKAKSGAHRLVTALEAQGHIYRLPGHARSIRLARGQSLDQRTIKLIAAASALVCNLEHEDPDKGVAIIKSTRLGDLDIALSELRDG